MPAFSQFLLPTVFQFCFGLYQIIKYNGIIIDTAGSKKPFKIVQDHATDLNRTLS